MKRLISVLVVLAAISPALSDVLPVADVLPVDVFARNPAYEAVDISPDGKYISALVPQEGRKSLVIINLAEMKVSASIRVGHRESVGGYDWVSDDRVVAEILSLDSASDRFLDYGELFGIDADGGNKKLLFSYRMASGGISSRVRKAESEFAAADILDPLLDEPRHALITVRPYSGAGESTPSIFRLDVSNGTKTRVTRTPIVNSSINGDLKSGVWTAVGQDLEGNLRVLWRDESDLDWQPLVVTDGGVDQFHVAGIDSDSGEILAFSNLETPHVSLVRMDPESGTSSVLLSDSDYDIGWVIRDIDGKDVVGACFEADKPRCEYLDMSNPASRAHASLQAAFPDQFVDIVSWTRDGSRAVLHVYADRNPGDFFLFDAESKKVEFLLSGREWVDPNQMAVMQPIKFDARDGVEIEGYLTRPRDAEGTTPMVVMVHGGPHGIRDIWGFDGEAQLLANRGYSVLNVNYRGSGGYGRKFERSGYRQWGAAIQDDITDGVRWAIENGHADPDRICIVGSSFGGYSALMSAVREPDMYQCAVGNVGVYDMELMFESGDIPGSRGGPEYLEMVLSRDPDQHQIQSPVHHVGKIKADLLIAYGQQDDRAPPVQSKRLINALNAAGIEHEAVAFRRAGHGIVDEEVRAEYFQRLIAFIDRSLTDGNESTGAR